MRTRSKREVDALRPLVSPELELQSQVIFVVLITLVQLPVY